MAIVIKAQFESEFGDIRTSDYTVSEIQDYCPLCRKGIKPECRYAWKNYKELQVIFECPINDCQKLFIAYYRQATAQERNFLDVEYIFDGSAPYRIEKRKFSKEIEGVSKEFCKIYNEALEAEKRGLKNICGAGYRRSLEFLIKDYLIKEKVEKPKIIKETFLGTCIDKYIDDGRIKDCAKRAAWIGNDETHYWRKWENKDLDDLKSLIELTVRWIESECLTKKYKGEMPEKAKTKKRKKT